MASKDVALGLGQTLRATEKVAAGDIETSKEALFVKGVDVENDRDFQRVVAEASAKAADEAKTKARAEAEAEAKAAVKVVDIVDDLKKVKELETGGVLTADQLDLMREHIFDKAGIRFPKSPTTVGEPVAPTPTPPPVSLSQRVARISVAGLKDVALTPVREGGLITADFMNALIQAVLQVNANVNAVNSAINGMTVVTDVKLVGGTSVTEAASGTSGRPVVDVAVFQQGLRQSVLTATGSNLTRVEKWIITDGEEFEAIITPAKVKATVALFQIEEESRFFKMFRKGLFLLASPGKEKVEIDFESSDT